MISNLSLGGAEPVGINGLTEAETSATASVFGLGITEFKTLAYIKTDDELEAYVQERIRLTLPVPAGYKLVPVEPTHAMCRAARGVPEPVKPYPPHFHLIWDAMLTAAPAGVEAC